MAINTDKYKVRSNILVRMLTPFFLKGLKVLKFLSGISYPLDELNVAYRKWVAERIVDAVTTFQPIVLKWSLNTRFRQYFKDKKAQGGLSVAGGCRCLTKDGNTSIEKEGYIPYPLQA